MGGLKLLRAGKKSLLGEESLDDGLDDWECGDMGLASGEQLWCSGKEVRIQWVRGPWPGCAPRLSVLCSLVTEPEPR